MCARTVLVLRGAISMIDKIESYGLSFFPNVFFLVLKSIMSLQVNECMESHGGAHRCFCFFFFFGRDEDSLLNSRCPRNVELRWQTEVSSSIYATPLVADINR